MDTSSPQESSKKQETLRPSSPSASLIGSHVNISPSQQYRTDRGTGVMQQAIGQLVTIGAINLSPIPNPDHTAPPVQVPPENPESADVPMYYQIPPHEVIPQEVLHSVYPGLFSNTSGSVLSEEALRSVLQQLNHEGLVKTQKLPSSHAQKMKGIQDSRSNEIIQTYKHNSQQHEMLQAVEQAWMDFKAPFYALRVRTLFSEKLMEDAKKRLGKEKISDPEQSQRTCKRFLNILKEATVLFYAQYFKKFQDWQLRDNGKREEAKSFVRAVTYCLHGFNELQHSQEVTTLKKKINLHMINLKSKDGKSQSSRPNVLFQQAEKFFKSDPFTPMMISHQGRRNNHLSKKEVDLKENPSDFFLPKVKSSPSSAPTPVAAPPTPPSSSAPPAPVHPLFRPRGHPSLPNSHDSRMESGYPPPPSFYPDDFHHNNKRFRHPGSDWDQGRSTKYKFDRYAKWKQECPHYSFWWSVVHLFCSSAGTQENLKRRS